MTSPIAKALLALAVLAVVAAICLTLPIEISGYDAGGSAHPARHEVRP